MNSRMLFDALRALELRWRDLGDSFQQLAESLSEDETRLLVPADPASEELLIDLVSETPAGGFPSLRSRALEEANRVETALLALRADPTRPTDELLDNPAPPPDGVIEIIQRSGEVADAVREGAYIPPGGADPVTGPGFIVLFPVAADETLERSACRDRLTQLGDFIGDTLRGFRELTDASGFTERFEARGLRTSVNNLFAYPVLTSGASPRGGTSGGGAGYAGMNLGQTATVAIREVLGRVPRVSDTRSFVAALNYSFLVKEEAGGTVYSWTPRSYAGQTELGGGVTGAQASLAGRARVAVDNALPLLDNLYPLREDADDELIAAARSIVRTEFTQIVAELGTDGGPRVSRVDNLFGLLLTNRFNVAAGVDAVGHLGVLEYELGLRRELVNTLDEETNYTNFVALRDYVLSVRTGWEGFRGLLGSDLGTQFTLLSRALSVTAEAVEEVNDAMDSVYVGRAERQVASFVGVNGQRLLIDELLSWVATFASDEAPRLVHDGGRRGVESLIPTAQLLGRSLERLVHAILTDENLSEGLRQARVVNAIRELRGHVGRVETLAGRLRR